MRLILRLNKGVRLIFNKNSISEEEIILLEDNISQLNKDIGNIEQENFLSDFVAHPSEDREFIEQVPPSKNLFEQLRELCEETEEVPILFAFAEELKLEISLTFAPNHPIIFPVQSKLDSELICEENLAEDFVVCVMELCEFIEIFVFCDTFPVEESADCERIKEVPRWVVFPEEIRLDPHVIVPPNPPLIFPAQLTLQEEEIADEIFCRTFTLTESNDCDKIAQLTDVAGTISLKLHVREDWPSAEKRDFCNAFAVADKSDVPTTEIPDFCRTFADEEQSL